MNKKAVGIILSGILLTGVISCFLYKNEKKRETKSIEAKILAKEDSKITLQDTNNIIYTVKTDEINADIGDNILLEYTGILNKNVEIQEVSVIGYKTMATSKNADGIPNEWMDDGIFILYYILANQKLETLSLEEKIGQLFLVHYPNQNENNLIEKYKVGGFLFFEKDFTNKTEKEVQDMIKRLQNISKIPLLTAVDEEGGKVVRVSSNPNLVSSKFKSQKELYNNGGFEKIKEDTKEKSKILSKLGLNVNLAPVVDVSTDPNDYIYERTIGENTSLTSTYAETVIKAGKDTGVSYTLKHFPGYGSNSDTHTAASIDNRTLESIKTNDIPPFEKGINAGAEAVLVSHNTISNIDQNNPASLSPSVHNLLRNDLKFTGIIITDDLTMGATNSIDDVAVKAILAGNDLIITSKPEENINSIKKALEEGRLSEETINKLAFRILAWKYYKGLMFAK